MPDTLSELADRLLQAGKSAGADAADVMVVDSRSVSIDVLDGGLEQAERSESTEIGLRVIIGQKQACVSSSLLDDRTLTQMAERAVAMARETPDDPSIGLAETDQLATARDASELELFDPSDPPDVAAVEAFAKEAEAAAREVAGVSKVSKAVAGYGTTSVHLSATNGFSGGYTRSHQGAYCEAISGEGTEMQRDAYSDTRVFAADLDSADMIGRIAGERAVAAANPRKPKTGTYPVVFDERVASSLIGHLLMATNGRSIVRGSSWARDLLGKQVLPAGMTLTEDPLRKRVSGSRPFDGEGLPSAGRDIVKDGILTGWTLDLAHGRKLGMASTANASRNVGYPPGPSITNVSLTQSDHSRDDLLRDIGTGLLVTSMIGSTINPNTGDYSRGAIGFWVEHGEIAYPVAECTLAGNLKEMLLSIQAANDARPWLSRVVPSLLVEGMTLAGA